LTAALCDICGNIVSSRKIKIVPVKFRERTERVHICERCERRDREAPEKYIRKHFEVSGGVKVLHDKIVKLPGVPPRISGGVLQVRRSIAKVRALLFKPEKWPLKKDAVDITGIRIQVITKLVDAINVAQSLAEKAPSTAEVGAADITKARYYHLLGYIAQVLDSVLRSASQGELDDRLKRVEKILDELERKDQKPRAESSAASTPQTQR